MTARVTVDWQAEPSPAAPSGAAPEKENGMRNETVRDGYATNGAARAWMTLAGIVLVAVGLLGFISNPLVGASTNALVATDAVHNVVHLATGLLALYIAFALRGDMQANATIGFGVLYVVIFLAVVASPKLFGLFSVPANAVDHVIHVGLAAVSLAVGYMARGRSDSRATA